MENLPYPSILPLLLTTLLSSTIPLVAALFYTFNALNARLDARIKEVMDGVDARFQKLEQDVTALRADLNTLRTDLNTLCGEVQFLKGQFSAFFKLPTPPPIMGAEGDYCPPEA